MDRSRHSSQSIKPKVRDDFTPYRRGKHLGELDAESYDTIQRLITEARKNDARLREEHRSGDEE